MLGCQKSESDEGRVDVNLEFVKTGKQAVLWKIGTGQNQGGNLRHGWNVEIEPVDQMERHRNHQTGQKKPIGQKTTQSISVIGLLHELRDP